MLRRLPRVMKFTLGRCELTKVLFELEDGHLTETVFSQALGGGSSSSSMTPSAVGTHNTVSVSSQIGCKRRCHHCYSGGRFQRDLTASEMVGQVAAFAVDHKIEHVVFQGTGEPLDNPSVHHAAHFLSTSFHKLACTCDGVECGTHEAEGGAPSVCVSTVGSCRGIRELALVAPERLNLMLSVTPDVERLESLSELLASSDDFAARTGRRVALSYTMIDGLDTDRHVDALLEHMSGRTATHVLQLVQYHAHGSALPPGSGAAARPSASAAIRCCMARFREHGCRVGYGQYCEFPSELLA